MSNHYLITWRAGFIGSHMAALGIISISRLGFIKKLSTKLTLR